MNNKGMGWKTTMSACLLTTGLSLLAQPVAKPSIIDGTAYGVILDDPAMKSVLVKKDISYLNHSISHLHFDLYLPPDLKKDDYRPAIIFLNAIGDDPGHSKLKSWGIYSSWPRLIAAHGYIGISMETDGNRVEESIRGLFKFISNKENLYNIDINRLGVYAASANVSRSSKYLMSEQVNKGIKAAVLYYGRPPVGPFRKDLPVLFVIAEGDMNPGYNGLWSEVIKNNAPWTIKMATGLPHGFDAYSDNDEARKLVRETISFWKNQLDPVPTPSWKYSKGRDVLGSIQMDKPKSLRLLDSLIQENPGDLQALFFYANELRQEKKFPEAENMYKKILALDSKNVDALVALAVLSYSQDKNTEGEAYVAKAESSGGIGRDQYARLGFYLLALNKNKESAYNYEKALEISADGFDYYKLACAYAKINDIDNAVKALRHSIKTGYGSKQQVEGERDFDSLRNDNRYKELIAGMK